MSCLQFDTNLVLIPWTNLKEKICKIKQFLNYTLMVINKNILAILRIFLNLQKYFMKNLYTKQTYATFSAKFLTERKYLMNTLIFVRWKYI